MRACNDGRAASTQIEDECAELSGGGHDAMH